jgi:hypothetical protein
MESEHTWKKRFAFIPTVCAKDECVVWLGYYWERYNIISKRNEKVSKEPK